MVANSDPSYGMSLPIPTLDDILGVIEQEEGFGETQGRAGLVYDDHGSASGINPYGTAGNPTIGYGFNLNNQNALIAVLNGLVGSVNNLIAGQEKTCSGNVFQIVAQIAADGGPSAPKASDVVSYFTHLIDAYVAQGSEGSTGISIDDLQTYLTNALQQFCAGNAAQLFSQEGQGVLPSPVSGSSITFSFSDDSQGYAAAENVLINLIKGTPVSGAPLYIQGTSPATLSAILNQGATANGYWPISPGSSSPPVDSLPWEALVAANYQGAPTGWSYGIVDNDPSQTWEKLRYGDFNGKYTTRYYIQSQLFGLNGGSAADPTMLAFQDYEMLEEHRSQIIKYESTYGSNPDGNNPNSPAKSIQSANADISDMGQNYEDSGPQATAPLIYGQNGDPVNEQVQTLAQIFDPEKAVIKQYLQNTYGAGVSGSFIDGVRSTDIFDAPDAADISNGFAKINQDVVNVGVDSPTANHIAIGPDSLVAGEVQPGTSGAQVVLIGAQGNDLLIAGAGNELLKAGSGNDTLIGGSGVGVAGNDTLQGGSGYDTFVFSAPTSGAVTETINAPSGNGVIELDNGGQIEALGGSADEPLQTVAGANYTWSADGTSKGIQYVYDPTKGTLSITGGDVGSNTIVVQNFGINKAEAINPNGGSPSGFLGIYLPQSINIVGGATPTVPPEQFSQEHAVRPNATQQPAPQLNISTGGESTFTVSLGAPSDSAQTVTIGLQGATASDFALDDGSGNLIQFNNGSAVVTVPAGQSSLSLSLINTVDVGSSQSFTLSAAINDSNNNPTTITSSLGGSYTEGAPNPFGNNPKPPTPTGVVYPYTNPFYFLGYQNGYSSFSNGSVPNYAGFDGTHLNVAVYVPDGFGDSLTTSNAAAQNQLDAEGGTVTVAGVQITAMPSSFHQPGNNTGNNVISTAGTLPTIVQLGEGNNFITAGSFGGTDIDTWSGNNYVEFDAGGPGNDAVLGFGYPGDGNNLVTLKIPSGQNNSVIVLAGDGNNQIYGDGETSLNLQQALQEADNATSATGHQGSLLTALDGNNTIVGSTGNDAIAVGGGNNLIVLGPGSNTFLGGADLSAFTYGWSITSQNGFSGYWNGVTIQPSANAGSGPEADTYNGLPVGGGDDTIFGGAGANVIELSNGNNFVDLGSGSSTVIGGSGNNTVYAGSGHNVSVQGGGGSDYIVAGSGADTIVGRGGNNTIIGGSGSDVLFAGGVDSKWATDETGNNLVEAGSGAAQIQGSGGNDTLIGGAGNDSILAGAGNEYIEGGEGNNKLQGCTLSGAGSDILVSNGDGNDSIWAGAGDTTIYGGDGSDYIQGGNGGDNVIYAGDGGTAQTTTTVSLGAANSTVYGGLGIDYIGGGSGNDVIYTGDGGNTSTNTANTVVLGSGNTTVYGGAGYNIIQGGSGSDVLYCGDGGTSGYADQVIAGSGSATIYGGAGTSVLKDVGGGSDVIYTGSGDTTVDAGGTDTVVANSGDALIQANAGTTLVFGATVDPNDVSADVETDQSGNAALVIDTDQGSITVEGALTSNLAGIVFDDPEVLSVKQFMQQYVTDSSTTASDGGNVIVGNLDGTVYQGTGGRDTLSIWGDNDTLNSGSTVTGVSYGDYLLAAGNADYAVGGQGADTLVASGSNDTLVGGSNGGQTFVVNDNSAVIRNGLHSDTMVASVNETLVASVGTLELAPGTATLMATSDSIGGVLIGNSGADTLKSTTGNDTLIAGNGPTTMIGGSAGSDLFVVNNLNDVIQASANGAADTIQSSVSDSLTGAVRTLVLSSGGLMATAANGLADQLVSTGGDTLVSGSGNDTLMGGGAGTTTTFLFSNTGFGQDTILDNGGQIALEFGASANITASSLSIQETLSGGMPILTISDGAGDSITLTQSEFASVKSILMSDGSTSVPLSQLVSKQYGSQQTLNGPNGSLIVNTASNVSIVAGSTPVSDWGSHDTINGSSTGRFIDVEGSNSVVVGGSGHDTLYAGGASDSLKAGNGGATLEAVGSNDTLVGGTGNDLFIVNDPSTIFSLANNSGSDTLQTGALGLPGQGEFSLPNSINTLVLTGTADLFVAGNGSADFIQGNAGFDSLMDQQYGGAQSSAATAVTMVGGAGGAGFAVNNPYDTVINNGVFAGSAINSGVSFVMPANVQRLTLESSDIEGDASGTTQNVQVIGAFSGDTLLGGAGDDSLYAYTSQEVLNAGAGNTLLVGASAGQDDLESGSGVDTLEASSSGLGIDDSFGVNNSQDVVVANEGGNTVFTSVNWVATVADSTIDLTDVNGVYSNKTVSDGGLGQDDIADLAGSDPYNDEANTLIADGSDDTLQGGTGADTLVGAGSYDTLIGGWSLAVDTYVLSGDHQTAVLHNAADTLQVSNGMTDTVESTANVTLSADVGELQMAANSWSVTGSAAATAGADTLVASGAEDTLIAGSGNQVLVSNGQGTWMIGGSGIDTFTGTNGECVVNNIFDVVEGQLGIQASISFAATASSQSITLTGSAALTASDGGHQSVQLTGNAGNSMLIATGNYAQLFAGSGIDTMQASGNNELFVINSSNDVIQATGSGDSIDASANWTLQAGTNKLYLETNGIQGVAVSGNNLIETNFSGDTLVGGLGNDTVEGGPQGGYECVFVAGKGNSFVQLIYSTYEFGSGFGHDTITGDINPIVQFGSSISISNLSATTTTGTDGSSALLITDTVSSAQDGQNSSILINDAFSSGVTPQFTFGSNNLLSLSQFLALLNGDGGSPIISTVQGASLTGSGNDTIEAYGSNDTLTAGTGNNVLEAYGTNSLVLGNSAGSGSELMGMANGDTLVAGSPNDWLVGGSNAAVVFQINNTSDSYVEQDTLAADTVVSSVSDTLISGSGVNTLALTQTGCTAMASADGNSCTLVGSSVGADTLAGAWGIITINGATQHGAIGNDVFVANYTSDYIFQAGSSLTGSNDTIESSVPFKCQDYVHTLVLTGAGATGTGDFGTVYGGNDTLVADAINDTLQSGQYNNLMILNAAGDQAFDWNDTLGHATNSDTVQSAISTTLNSYVDTLILSGASLIGAANNDSVGDTLWASSLGADTLQGNTSSTAGGELLVIADSSDVIQKTKTTDTLGSLFSTSLTSADGVITHLRLMGSSNLIATASASNQVLGGNAGNSTLVAGAGLIDTLVSGSGNTVFQISSTADVIQSGKLGDTLSSSASSTTLTAGVGTLALANSSEAGYANSTSDTLAAAATGTDTLYGNTTASGFDTFVIYNTGDLIQSGKSADLIESYTSVTLPSGQITHLTLMGNGPLSAAATVSNAVLTGNAGNSTLVASGSTVTDTLIGGTGNTTYVINNAGNVIQGKAADTIAASCSDTLSGGVLNLALQGTGNYQAVATVAGAALSANSGADTLVSATMGSGDTLIGNATSSAGDIFVLNNTADLIQNGKSLDTIESGFSESLGTTGPGALLLLGNAALSATAGAGNQTITGNAGSSTLSGGYSGDSLVSGSGNTLFIINAASVNVSDNYTTNQDTLESSVSAALGPHVDTLILTGTASLIGAANADSVGDTLISNSGQDTLTGNTSSTAGGELFEVNNSNDVIQSGKQADTVEAFVNYTLTSTSSATRLILGGSGDPVAAAGGSGQILTSNAGNSTLVAATSGSDTLQGNASGATVYEINTSTDTIQNGQSWDTVIASVNDTLASGVDTLILTGTATIGSANQDSVGNVLVSNSSLQSTLVGNSAGDETFVINVAGDSIQGGKSGDTIESAVNDSLSSTSAITQLYLLGTASLVASVANSNALLTGNSGADILTATGSSDTLAGGGGNTLFVLSGANDVATDANSGVSDTVQSSGNVTLGAHIDTLLLTGTASLIGAANGDSDTLISNSGQDTLIGGAWAGMGNELYVINNSQDVIQNGKAGDTIESSVTYALSGGINTLWLTGANAISGSSTVSGAVIGLAGATGQDTLVSSSAGTGDTLIGNNSTLAAGDVLVLNNVDDVIVNGKATDTIESSLSQTLAGAAAHLILTGSASLTGASSLGGAVLTANSGADTLISATTGTGDTLVGNATSSFGEVFIVNNAGDSISGGKTLDTVQAYASLTLGSGLSNVSLMGSANLSASAGAGNQTLTGNAGNSTLTGGYAGDSLVSGIGNTLFVIGNASVTASNNYTFNQDTIQSAFSTTLGSNINTLQLTAASLTGIANSGSDTLIATAGADTLYGNTVGGAELFEVVSSTDVIQSYKSADTLEAFYNNATLKSGIGTLMLGGARGLKATGNGSSTLISNSGVDTLVSGGGTTTYIVNNAGDIIQSSNSADLIESNTSFTLSGATSGLVSNLMLMGTSSLMATCTVSNAELIANAGNSTLNAAGASGIDTLVSGTGNTLFVIGSNSTDVILSGKATDTVQASGSDTLAAGVGTLQLMGASLTGWAASNNVDTLVSSSAGLDTLVGTTNSTIGGDVFVVNYTGDVIQSGRSADTLESSVNETLSSGTTQNIANLVLMGATGLSATSSVSGAVLYANTGADTLISSSAGSGDTLIGNSATTSGAELFVVNNTADVIVAGKLADTMQATVSNTTLASGVGMLQLSKINLIGYASNSGSDTLVADTVGADTLVGNRGSLAGGELFVVYTSTDVIASGTGKHADTLQSSVNNTTLTSGVGTLRLTKASIAGYANAYANETLVASAASDTLVGNSASADVFVINYATDSVQGGKGVDTIESGVNYTLTGANTLILSGANSLRGAANGNADTLISNTGQDTLIGNSTISAGDVFVVNNSLDIIQSGKAADTLDAYISFAMTSVNSAGINDLALMGTAALTATASSTIGGEVLTGNAGNSTLAALGGSGIVDTLISGTGKTLFEIGNASDVIVSGKVTDTIGSFVNDTLSSSTGNIRNLELLGSNALMATSSISGAVLTANSGSDTLVSATNGANTLVGGSGNDLFVVNNAADVVVGNSSTTIDTIQSTVSDSLVANVNTLILTGTAGISGTANSSSDLLMANGGNDTLFGGTGVDVLEAKTGNDELFDTSGQAALAGGSAQDALMGVGASFNDFYGAGLSGDIIATGASNNVIGVNQGDGNTVINPTVGSSNILSLGGGINSASLSFSQSGNNLVLTDGVTGDSITLSNWYANPSYQTITTLQVVNPSSGVVEEYDFGALFSQFQAAVAGGASSTNWSVASSLSGDTITSAAGEAYGGALAYTYGMTGSLTGLSITDATSTLTDTLFGSGLQSTLGGGSGGQPLIQPSGGKHKKPQGAHRGWIDFSPGDANHGLGNQAYEHGASQATPVTLLKAQEAMAAQAFRNHQTENDEATPTSQSPSTVSHTSTTAPKLQPLGTSGTSTTTNSAGTGNWIDPDGIVLPGATSDESQPAALPIVNNGSMQDSAAPPSTNFVLPSTIPTYPIVTPMELGPDFLGFNSLAAPYQSPQKLPSGSTSHASPNPVHPSAAMQEWTAPPVSGGSKLVTPWTMMHAQLDQQLKTTTAWDEGPALSESAGSDLSHAALGNAGTPYHANGTVAAPDFRPWNPSRTES